MKILGTGLVLPLIKVENQDLAHILPPDVVERKTGIKTRFVARSETVSEMAAQAVEEACESSYVPIGSIKHLVCSTNSGGQWVPPTVARVARQLGYQGPGFDINAACAGSVTALRLALQLPSPSAVVAAEHVTRFTSRQSGDWPSVIFGDGAGSAIIEPGEAPVGRVGGICPEGHDWMQVPDGGYGQMNGPKLWEAAIPLMTMALNRAAEQCGLRPQNLDIIVPHQANRRIIEACIEKWNVPSERVVITVDRFGNTSSASVLMALAWANLHGKLERGQWIGFVAFGAGLIWEALVTPLE